MRRKSVRTARGQVDIAVVEKARVFVLERDAEVTVGGIDTRDLSSKTMEARQVPGLYAIGEAVDVTGWLGGYNFQWAWASGWAAGQVA